MRIQVIGFSKEGQDGNVFYSTMQSPCALDEFDMNVIDLTNDSIWVNDSNSNKTINIANDFSSIKTMINNRKTSVMLFVLPQNSTFYFHKHVYASRWIYDDIRMKDMLSDLCTAILPRIMPCNINSELIFENTKTAVHNIYYQASFYFSGTVQTLTQSEKSEKTTTIQLSENIYATTLHITKSTEELVNFIHSIFKKEKEPIPEWMEKIQYFDDAQQELIIQESQERIRQEQQTIQQAQEHLKENALYKSILYTSGDELVEGVFKILEKMLDYDLSEFRDIKKEDFLVHKKGYTLIGEIKGVNSNVKRENISQVDVHYQRYIDELQAKGLEENVHQVLIINPFRMKPLDEREPIHIDQIHLATLYQSLIIETKTLLHMFELFLQDKLTTEDCERIFITKTGLLLEEDISGLSEDE